MTDQGYPWAEDVSAGKQILEVQVPRIPQTIDDVIRQGSDGVLFREYVQLGKLMESFVGILLRGER